MANCSISLCIFANCLKIDVQILVSNDEVICGCLVVIVHDIQNLVSNDEVLCGCLC